MWRSSLVWMWLVGVVGVIGMGVGTLERETPSSVRRAEARILAAAAAAPPPLPHHQQPYFLDPALYLLSASQFPGQEDDEGIARGKRMGGPSLSIAEPIDLLRTRVRMQMARQKLQKQNENQVLANRIFLDSVGKRQAHSPDRSAELGDSYEYYRNMAAPDWDSS